MNLRHEDLVRGGAETRRLRHSEKERLILLRELADGGQSVLDIRVFVSSGVVDGKRVPGAAALITWGRRWAGERIGIDKQYYANIEHVGSYTVTASRWVVSDPAKPNRRGEALRLIRNHVFALANKFRRADAALVAYAKAKSHRPYQLTNQIGEGWRIPKSKLYAYKEERDALAREANEKALARAAIDKDFGWVNGTVRVDIPNIETGGGK